MPLNYDQAHQSVDEGLLTAARTLGLSAALEVSTTSRIITTGLEHLLLCPGTAALLENEGVCNGCSFAVEVAVKDPQSNSALISQVVSRFGVVHKSGREALTALTGEWVEGTLPPLCRLFGVECGKLAGKLNIESYTEGDSQMTLWEGFIGDLQVTGEMPLGQSLHGGTPYGLVHETLMDYLGVKGLHWLEIQGVRHSNGQTEVKVEIDNEVAPQACAEASSKFDWSPFPNPCGFRQFIVVRPCGAKPVEDASEDIAQSMREYEIDTTPREQRPLSSEPTLPDTKKPKLRWPFGRRS